jgi:hypothetical protein
MTEKKHNKIFFLTVFVCYSLTIFLSYLRIYVYHAYPTYTDPEQIPSLSSELFNFTNFLQP